MGDDRAPQDPHPPDAADDARTEELSPPQEDRTALRRLRRDLAVGMLVLAAVYGIARAASHHHGGSPAGRPATAATSSSPARSPVHATPFVTVSRVDGGWIPAAPPPAIAELRRCPAGRTCSVSNAVASPLRDALATHFPGSVIASVETVTLAGGRLWFRQVVATVAGGRLAVWVTSPAGPAPRVPVAGGTVVATALRGHVVTLRATPRRAASPAVLRQLGRDPRLLVQ